MAKSKSKCCRIAKRFARSREFPAPSTEFPFRKTGAIWSPRLANRDCSARHAFMPLELASLSRNYAVKKTAFSAADLVTDAQCWQPAANETQTSYTRSTSGYNNTIKLWTVADGKEIRTLDGHNGPVFELAFRPSVGNAVSGVPFVLASASGDRTVKLWNVDTGERLDTLKESLKELYTLVFSPDGSRLAAAGIDNRIRVWQVTAEAREGTNPLLASIFAHQSPVLPLV